MYELRELELQKQELLEELQGCKLVASWQVLLAYELVCDQREQGLQKQELLVNVLGVLEAYKLRLVELHELPEGLHGQVLEHKLELHELLEELQGQVLEAYELGLQVVRGLVVPLRGQKMMKLREDVQLQAQVYLLTVAVIE